MKIINLDHSTAYQLAPGTQLDIERTNLFFNEYGEQSYPVDLPATSTNLQLTGYPDDLHQSKKADQDIDCVIQNGAYSMPARQAVLSANTKTGISTAFYINEGSFLTKLSEVKLTDVFGEESIPGVNTVDQGIAFCRTLLDNSHPQFAIAPFFVDLDAERRMVNQINYYNASGAYDSNGKIDFHAAWARKETVNSATVVLDKGYYMTPFIRVYYVLERVLQHFGYTLNTNFFGTTTPFREMVFINNTIDALVNGDIRIAHLVPDCYCNTLLDLFRKKFCCEFVTDEIQKTVSIRFFKDSIQQPPAHDLSKSAVSKLDIEYPNYKQLSLKSETSISSFDLFESTAELATKYPEAYLDEKTGMYMRTGYSEADVINQVVAAENQPYRIDEDLEFHDIEVPDCTYSLKAVAEFAPERPGRNNLLSRSTRIPYVGDGRTLNSTLVVSSSSDDSTSESASAKVSEQLPVLSFMYVDIVSWATNHKIEGWSYSLLYNGASGIFETFYRDFDNLLRNSLHPVKVDLLLSEQQKMNISAQDKICIDGQHLLINKLNYKIGGSNEPVESDLLTTRLYTPLNLAPSESERFVQNKTYKWKINKQETTISAAEFELSSVQVDKDNERSSPLTAIYPPAPTTDIYNTGGKYYSRSYSYKQTGRDGVVFYAKVEWWLTAILFSESSTTDRG